MIANPKIAICAMSEGKVLRIQALAVEDDRVEAKQSMLDANPHLKNMYSPTDDNTQVLYLTKATATISSGPDKPKIIEF
jgi:uncharacterized pyridoxamine 5'-phosphate oxidase family protein